MIRSFFPIIASICFILFFGLLSILFFRLFNKVWWKKRWVRKVAWSLPLFGISSVLLWGIGEYNAWDILVYPGAFGGMLSFILEFCLILSLPFSGILHFTNSMIEKFSRSAREKDSEIDHHRRKILQSTAAAIPLITLSAGTAGVVRALTNVNVYKRPITFKNLPDDLNGLKILHLSDIHLRHYVTLSDVEKILEDAEMFNPDLVMMTGDISDEMHLLPDLIRMVEQLKPRLGTFATLGNHEYFRGVEKAIASYERSNTPLFIDKAAELQIGNSTLLIGGIDDPRRMGAKDYSFFKTTIDKMLVDETSPDFRILMSHRPDALDYASEVGIDLTLAGHTHGGQIGFGGRSVFESYFPDRYLWGEYTRGKSKLYTSSGAGHWFPFRLGCPAEAPVIELVKA
ncbi:MAG: metallophosphoesterase [Calditrichaeota bacterium]|nr:MAG: metallophosphoesterase [Calditrichota bacterium]